MTPSPSAADRYVREHLLGEGGMGRVWAARDRNLDRRVALKEPRGRVNGPASQRLSREATVLASLDHPGIVPLLDQGLLPDGRPFLVMRLVGGDDLAHQPAVHSVSDRIARARRLRDVVAAVAHAHSRKVVHRDLKPANVRIDRDGAVQILDWGLARIVGDDSPVVPRDDSLPLTRVGSRLGTPAYMSPEQAAGEVVGPRSDVWALGLLLWEGLSGQRAYTGRAASEVLAGVLSGPPRALKRVVPKLPAVLCEVVDGALSPKEDRPADAGVLLKHLDAALRSLEARGLGRQGTAWAWARGVGGGLAGAALFGVAWAMWPPALEIPSDDQLAVLLEQGDMLVAERAAARRLEHVPDDPVARGALVRSLPPPTLVWEAAAPDCTIGEVIRWDGRAVGCASEGSTKYYELGPDGIIKRWEKSYENHILVFMGEAHLVGKPPRTDSLVVLNTDNGAPSHGFPVGFGAAGIQGSRNETVLIGEVDSQADGTPGDAHWVLERAELRNHASFVRKRFERNPFELFVLSDGNELFLDGDHLRLRTIGSEGGELLRSWTVPEQHGRPTGYAVSSGERMVAVATDLGRVAVASLTAQGWSTWADHGVQYSRFLAVTDDGRHVGASIKDRAVVWSTESPGKLVQLPGVGGLVKFPSDHEVVSYGRDKVRWWHLAEPLNKGILDAGGAVSGLVWGQGGIIARHRHGARVWDSNGRLVMDVDSAIAIGREVDGPRRYVVDASGNVHLFKDDRRIVDKDGKAVTYPTPGCRFTDWPAGGPIVCADEYGGPYLLNPDTGVVDKRIALGAHRWAYVGAAGPHLAMMDWDTRIFSLQDDTLKPHFDVPWANMVLPTITGDAVLLNGRRGMVARPLDGSEDLNVCTDWGRSTKVGLSPDGQWLAVRAFFGGLQVWKVDTGELALRLPDSMDSFTSLAWAPDGQRIALGGSDGSVRLLDMSPLTLPADALQARVASTWLSADPLSAP